MAFAGASAQTEPCIIETFADGDGVAAGVALDAPDQLDEGPDGSIYISDLGLRKILRVHPDGATSSIEVDGLRDFFVDRDSNVVVNRQSFAERIAPDGSTTRTLGLRPLDSGCAIPNCPVGSAGEYIQIRSIRSIDGDSAGNTYAVVEGLTNSTHYLVKLTPDATLAAQPIQIENGTVFVDAADNVHLPYRQWEIYSPGGEKSVDDERTTVAQFASTYAVASDGSTYLGTNLTGPDRIARLRPGLIYDQIAGDLDPGFAEAGGPAAASRLSDVRDLLLASDDSLYIADRGNRRVRRITRVSECPSAGPRPLPLHAGSAANYQFLAPGSVFTLFGVRLGPGELVSATLGAENRLPRELAGIKVFFDGVAAPLLYVSAGQLSGVVPFATQPNVTVPESGAYQLTEPLSRVRVETAAGVSDDLRTQIFPATPAIFTLDASGRGPAAALNQDGSLNTADNPARRGEVVVLWATGFGTMNPTPMDGEISGESLPIPVEPVDVRLSGEPTELLYAAAAPGLVAGVVQLNVRVLPTQQFTGTVEVTVKAGNLTPHRGVTVFVAP